VISAPVAIELQDEANRGSKGVSAATPGSSMTGRAKVKTEQEDLWIEVGKKGKAKVRR
jgi:hypothetical protein